MSKIGFWINNARYIALPQSILPAVLAMVMAINYTGFSWWLSLVALFGIICAHLGFNLADDYFDYKKADVSLRSEIQTDSIRKRMDKCHYIQSGKATVKQLAVAIICFLILAAVAGGVIFVFRGWPIAVFALVGLFLGISYSGFPLYLSFYGLGELVIGLMFGPLLMLGMFYAACGEFSSEMLWLSLAVGLLVTNIVYTHSVMETDADAQMKKMTFARLLRNRVVMLVFSGILTFLPFLMVAFAVWCGQLHGACMFTWLLLPVAVYLLCSLTRFKYGLPTNDTPRWWMGPMGDFAKYRTAGVDWFLIRWLLARNLLTFFCLIIVVVYAVLAIVK